MKAAILKFFRITKTAQRAEPLRAQQKSVVRTRSFVRPCLAKANQRRRVRVFQFSLLWDSIVYPGQINSPEFNFWLPPKII